MIGPTYVAPDQSEAFSKLPDQSQPERQDKLRLTLAKAFWVSRGGPPENFKNHLSGQFVYEYPPFVACMKDADTALTALSSSNGAEGWDDLNPVRSTLRVLEKDLRACVISLGEGDDLGAVLEGYANAAAFALSRRDTAAPPKPAPDAMREALATKIEKAWRWNHVTSNGGFIESLATDEQALIVAALRSAHVPSPDGVPLKTLIDCTVDLANNYEPSGAVSLIDDNHLSPATGAAEPGDQDPPMKWLIERLRGLAIELVADPKTPWIGERDPKQHICWTAADRLAAPSDLGNRIQRAVEVIDINIGSINRSVAAELKKILVSPVLHVQPGAGEGEREALEPFAAFGFDESGNNIRDGLMRDRICDWFGPSDFDAARAAFQRLPKVTTGVPHD